jgi:hypothetical protein
MNAERPNENAPALLTRALPDYHLLRPNIVAMPMHLNGPDGPRDLLSSGQDGRPRANLSEMARAYLASLQLPNPDEDIETAELVWLHALALCYTPAYLAANEDGVKRDFPRIPLPPDAAVLRNSARLGALLADLLDPDQEITGVTRGTISQALRGLGAVKRVETAPGPVDLRVTIGWSYEGRDGVIMPGGGRIEAQPHWTDADELQAALRALVPNATEPLGLLGEPINVYLNSDTYWTAVPRAVWEYRIGGYQVVKKWLSYRQHDLLARALTVDESRHVTNMIRRLAMIILLGDELDANYCASRGSD